MISLAAVFVVATPPLQSQAAPCDAPITNEIACENTKAGSPASEWDISGSGSSAIEGFATDISVNRGSTVGFKVKTASASYRLDIYRMGYYGGSGARKITTINVGTKTTQPACTTQSSTGLIDCGNWTQTASWAVPSTAVSGVYFAHLVSGSNDNHIFFIVRNDASTSDLLFQTSDTTWQAYNSWGGNSLYVGNPAGRAYKVSYNRPFNTRAGATSYDWVFNAEYPAIRYLEANGYDLSYTTGVDSDRRGNLIKNHKTFLSVGHDEYWSGGQRTNVEAARDAGVNLAFWSGNEVFWKTRWENSIAGASTAYRTLVTYKETATGTKLDPTPTWTGTWRDPRLSPPADGGKPENSLTGTMFTVNCCTTDMNVDGVDGQMRFWRNTRVANLSPSQDTTLGSGILGYEWDESPDNGYRPAGLINLSTTSENVSSYLQDYGWNYAPGAATHHLTLYRAASGALVFGAGSVQWAWGLDDTHDNTSNTADLAVQQATMNLLADMGAQPATRQSGLVAATASTDTTAPTSTISAPAAGATIPVGQPVTISGTASDVGGKVGGVEVSTDGGTSWHPATGRGSWTYTFTPGANGTLTIKTRATDDSLRSEAPGAGRTVTVGSGGGTGGNCPCTIFAPTSTPVVASDPDGSPLEIGVKFRASQAGFITGIRFYKGGSSNGGTHVGSLWNASGTKLASATFTNESASGWQQVSFANPVSITANTTYVASYYAPTGHYAADDGYFTTAITNGPLSALADGAEGANGVYKAGTTGFPTQAYAKSNYWVDVVFSTDTTDTTKPTVTATSPADGATGVATSSAITATFSEPVQSSTIAVSVTGAGGAAVAGASSYDAATRKVTFTPSAALAAGTSHTVTVSGAKDTAGNTMTDVSWSFTTAAADTTPPTVSGRSPAAGATNVATSSTVTATFSEALQAGTASVALANGASSVPGTLAYDAPSRTATFTPTAALASSTTYTVTVSGAKDTAGNTMTTLTWTFTTAASDTTPPTVSGRSPAAGATNVATSSTVTATFSEALQAGTASVALANGASSVAGSVAYNATTRTATFTPTAALANSTTYTATVSGAKDTAGNTMTTVTWTFTTAAASSSGCPCSIWAATATPAVAADPDTDGIEIGLKFRTSQAGSITGVRFYKGSTNTGTHVGSLWSRTGTKLASVTFTGETASGWQQASFASPVAVAANTTYVISYYAPNGHYSVTENAFASAATTRGPLTALKNGTDGTNGVYAYGASGFPTSSYNSSNYWVDVVLATP